MSSNRRDRIQLHNDVNATADMGWRITPQPGGWIELLGLQFFVTAPAAAANGQVTYAYQNDPTDLWIQPYLADIAPACITHTRDCSVGMTPVFDGAGVPAPNPVIMQSYPILPGLHDRALDIAIEANGNTLFQAVLTWREHYAIR